MFYYAALSSERSGVTGAEGVLPTLKRLPFRKSLTGSRPVLVVPPDVSSKSQIVTKSAPMAPATMMSR